MTHPAMTAEQRGCDHALSVRTTHKNQFGLTVKCGRPMCKMTLLRAKPNIELTTGKSTAKKVSLLRQAMDPKHELPEDRVTSIARAIRAETDGLPSGQMMKVSTTHRNTPKEIITQALSEPINALAM